MGQNNQHQKFYLKHGHPILPRLSKKTTSLELVDTYCKCFQANRKIDLGVPDFYEEDISSFTSLKKLTIIDCESTCPFAPCIIFPKTIQSLDLSNVRTMSKMELCDHIYFPKLIEISISCDIYTSFKNFFTKYLYKASMLEKLTVTWTTYVKDRFISRSNCSLTMALALFYWLDVKDILHISSNEISMEYNVCLQNETNVTRVLNLAKDISQVSVLKNIILEYIMNLRFL